MARTSKEDLDKWFDNNVDIENRTIYMGSVNKEDGVESGVDSFMTESFIKALHVLEAKSNDSINILMNNPGGDWYHGMAIFDAIKTSNCYCTIKVYGHAMSMGSLILQAADHKILMPNSRFMIHYGYNGNSGHTKIFEKWADEGKRLNFDMENIYLQSMLDKEEKEGHGYLAKKLGEIMTRQYALNYPPPTSPKTYNFSKSNKKEEIREVLKEMLNFDTILSAKETVDLGFADEIETYKTQ